MRANPSATSNVSVYGMRHNHKSPSVLNENTPSQEQTKTDVAVKVDISENARVISKGLSVYSENSALKLDEKFFGQEIKEQRRSDFANKLMHSVDIDPFDNEFQILAVTGIFNDGTLEKFVADGLDGKAKNPSFVANELGQMIRGAIYNPNATVEERATNREIALKNVEAIAQKYFDNPDEAKAFLEGINRFAENDVLREKGYVVIDNVDITPFRSYTLATDDSVSWSEYAKKYGKSDLGESLQIRKNWNRL